MFSFIITIPPPPSVVPLPLHKGGFFEDYIIIFNTFSQRLKILNKGVQGQSPCVVLRGEGGESKLPLVFATFVAQK